MLSTALRYSDSVIVTSDNPRTEDPTSIISDIIEGVDLKTSSISIEPDREVAIKEAIRNAESGDIILVAGKGHENYQIIGKDKNIFFRPEVC